jgi:hypothetical protein
MAFVLRNIEQYGSGGIFKMLSYDAGADDIATVEGAGYFDELAIQSPAGGVLNDGDVILVKASDGHKFYAVTVTSTTVTLSTSLGPFV